MAYVISCFFTVRCTIVQSAVLRLHVVGPSVCLSVRPSVTLVDQDHIRRKSSKPIARTISATPSLLGGVGKIGVLENKRGNISETRKDRGKVTMEGL